MVSHKVSGGLQSLRSFRTLPPFPASLLAQELVSGGPLPLPVAEGGHAPGHLTGQPSPDDSILPGVEAFFRPLCLTMTDSF